jgi:hypothetical protein
MQLMYLMNNALRERRREARKRRSSSQRLEMVKALPFSILYLYLSKITLKAIYLSSTNQKE